jgi:biuret amidohydrolase
MTGRALLVIDMQYDFLGHGDRPPYVVGAEQALERTLEAVSAARAAGVPVVLTQELHRPDGVDGGRFLWDGRGGWLAGGDEGGAPPAPPCIEGTRGAELVAELGPEEGDVVVPKRRQSAFLGTDLDLVLRRLGADTLFVAGVCSNVCVLWTVGDAFQRDYRVRVLEDCVAGTSEPLHAAALEIMRATATPGERVVAADFVDAVARASTS